MCGIAGVSPPGPDAAVALHAMLDAIAHRGPDGRGVHIDGTLALGHCRLAVIDLAGGKQPRVDAGSGDALSFNGEIYGYRALAAELAPAGVALADRSDTEVLFQLIRHVGLDAALARIDGMFAFAWRDGRSGAISLVRDRYGEKPLYYGIASGAIVFASEAGAILAHPLFRTASPDLDAAYQLLQFEYVTGEHSGWTGIRKLRPGHVLRFHDGHAECTAYWRPRLGHAPHPGDLQAIDALDELLQRAVQRQCVADVPLGMFLSGGLDSSLVAAMAARARPDMTALTVSIDGDGFDETAYAADVARALGLRHQVVRFGAADIVAAAEAIDAKLSEPLADSSLLPSWLVCRAARSRMTVALGGDGADELFAGYPNFKVRRLAWLMRALPPRAGEALARAMAAVPGGGYMSLPFRLGQLANGFGQSPGRQSAHWMAPFGPAAMRSLWAPGIDQPALHARAFSGAAHAGGIDDMLLDFLTGYLPDDILTKTDRASMFNGLEVRAPFLDRGFAEYAAALPASLKLRGNTGKWALKQLARRYLPDRVVFRRKHGFGVPIGALLRGPLRERCRDTLLSRDNPVASWFASGAIEALLRAHLDRGHEHGKRLWALHVLFTVAGRKPRAGIAPATRR